MTVRRESALSHGPLDPSRAPNSPSARLNRKPSTALRCLLADHVTRLRTARGLTQIQLAAACGLSPGYVGDIEFVKPVISFVEAGDYCIKVVGARALYANYTELA